MCENEELIRQMLEALKRCEPFAVIPPLNEAVREAIAAAEAALDVP